MKKLLVLLFAGQLMAGDFTPKTVAIVNFTSCVTDSKYGKYEQEQLENIRKQYSTLIEEKEKEIKELAGKFEDQDYMDGLSPEAQQEKSAEYQTKNEEHNRLQSQLYQILQQANYFFIQRMSQNISKASKKIAEVQKIDIVVNREAIFYFEPKLDITTAVLTEMDKNFEEDKKQNALSENKEAKQPIVPENTTKAKK